ncbi:Protein of unknown function [Pyronema omphalodes CBS 100304]|uniref:Uncharacterized protein n=1 Tax=Pyronema omphalodes (strain CBS 100304) TaxID=1076935 RepID=U4LV77_PYROM|nr:Protein of unknown function [Pyronema omphalodes CBS 100304]
MSPRLPARTRRNELQNDFSRSSQLQPRTVVACLDVSQLGALGPFLTAQRPGKIRCFRNSQSSSDCFEQREHRCWGTGSRTPRNRTNVSTEFQDESNKHRMFPSTPL